jgi:hypothetical protein
MARRQAPPRRAPGAARRVGSGGRTFLSELPIACTLTPGELAQRRESLLARLVAGAKRVERLERGLRFELAGDAESLRVAFAAIEAERRCCRFLRFDLELAPDLGPVVLTVDGPAGTRELLESVLPL